jgi:hypothetical protein
MRRAWISGWPLAVLVGLGLASSEAWAQSWESARLLGLADAERAFASSTDAIFTNPGGMALSSMYALELGYLDDLSGTDRRYNLSILDSQAGPVAGGIAYTFADRKAFNMIDGRDHSIQGHRLDVAVASKIGDRMAVGLNGHYLNFSDNPGGPGSGGFSAFTVDAGFQYRAEIGLGAGLTAYNLTNSDRPEIPLGWAAALGWANDVFSIEGDFLWNAKIGRGRVNGAGSLVIARVVALRLGGTYDLSNDSSSISFGAGYSADQFGIDLGYRQRISGPGVAVTFGPAGEFLPSEKILGLTLRGMFAM